ncbi:hypothetical protein FJ414_27890 [Mesorhizobium sp. B3-1-6]|nr:hypothetical protein FJ414_27890 [Mesorhizobium sp. B3-1-6]
MRHADIQVRSACEWQFPALPVLTCPNARSVPAFAGRSSHEGLRATKATAGLGRFSEPTVLDSP